MINYCSPILPEYEGNPLIEALPQFVDDATIIKKLAYFPPYDHKERTYEPHVRKHYLERLKRLRQPLPEYIECFRIIERILCEGYSAKNPLSPTTAHYLHYLDTEATIYAPKTGRFQSEGVAAGLVGISGVGKTKMVLQVLNYFPQVIRHSGYRGGSFKINQIVWIKVKCPHDTSVRGLCHSIIDEIDILQNDRSKYEKTIDSLMTQITRLVRKSFLGVLVIDDFQNIDSNNKSGKKLLINFLLNLIDKSGVPILFIGNPEATKVLKETFRTARRGESAGYIKMDRMSKNFWDLVVSPAIWRYQWTDEKTDFSDALSDKLYSLSQGILDIAVRIYIESQRSVIGTGDERISASVLDHGYRHACKLTDLGLTLLKDNDPLAPELYRDLYFDSEIKLNENKNNKIESEIIEESRDEPAVTPDIIRDLYRPQHPEFMNRLNEIKQRSVILPRGYNSNIIRSCFGDLDPIEALRKSGYLIENAENLNQN
jgi:hypothetical protein